MKWAAQCAAILLLGGCSTMVDPAGAPSWPASSVGALCAAGRFHEAMKVLPTEMAAWAEYTKRTGSTAEGTAGYLYATTMAQIANKGDVDWGRILDDPDIPYDYKTAMIFEVAEARLGKGASWSPERGGVAIIPRSGRADSWEDIYSLLREVLREPGDTADADKPPR